MPREPGDNRRARIPDHVVRRDFPEETVILNLETQEYHGLNATAQRMLGALEEADCIGSAAAALAREFNASREEIERDLLELCGALDHRGLLEIDDAQVA
jgi:hypothetical protein